MPTRYLKPGICDSAHIESVKTPQAEILYYRLLVTVDDFGRFDARPLVVKARCFPVKESVNSKLIQQWLAELVDAGLIVLYSVDGAPYLQMQRWGNTPRAKESLFPQMNTDVCNRIHTNTSVEQLHTVLPVTVTVTETETVTDNSLVASLLVDVDEQVVKDWKALRKQKKAPVNSTVINGLRREAGKAGMSLQAVLEECCRQGWQGFKAEWMAAKINGAPAAPVSVANYHKPFEDKPDTFVKQEMPDFVKALSLKFKGAQ